nr:hypothetical protein [Tanacetum cinerariifolium]
MATTIEQQVALDEALVSSTQREMLYICPRIHGQAFAKLPFEEEILEFIRFLGHGATIRTLTDININKLYQPWRSFAVIINKCLTGKSSGYDSLRLSQAQILNSKAYKEYYALATGKAVPKPKASARRKRSGSDTSITPPTATTTPTTTVAVTPRLTAAAKGKQPAKSKSPSDPSEVTRTEAQQLKIILRRSRQQTHISQLGGSGADAQEKVSDYDEGDERDESDDEEENDDDDKDGDERDNDDDDEHEIAKIDEQDDTKRGVDDDEETKSYEESDGEETREEESFDPIPRTPEDSKDDGDGKEDQGVRISEEEKLNEEEKAEELYIDQESLSVSSHSVTSMLNPPSDAADISEMELKKILIEKMEGNKSIQHSDEQRNLYKALVEAYDADKTILDTYRESTILKRRREDDDQEGPSAGSDRGSKRQREGGEHASASTPSKTATGSAGRSTTGRPPTPNRDWNKTLPAAQGNAQSWISELARQTDARSSFNELLDTPIDFSNFIMNRLGIDTLTPKLLAGPTYELMRGSCNSLTELEYHLEEVYKVTTDQLDRVNPEGQQYPHNLLQPLPLISDNRGRHVIPFEHFINNDLEYLQGGASSRKYTTSVTKTKAADYGHIKWIEDLGRKRQQFYGFVVNRESALDVYSKKRIIAVTELKIVEWHNYKHLDWISRRVEDLQLGVESYQKRLNLTKPDTYRPDLKRREAYTAYSNPKGFIYQNKDKKNRLMWIDELYKFSDGTLNDVRNALEDHLKGIRMQYLPTIIWRRGDKDRTAAMIQAIDKMLKTRRIMRSLEKFIGGRLYEGDFRMLQRTIWFIICCSYLNR